MKFDKVPLARKQISAVIALDRGSILYLLQGRRGVRACEIR